ncbi:acetate uptake transporter [Rhodococcus chondri]|uniref:Acetate uptake transporter n=1 Tax=Rhodococcus chondri TaxID=3065941 RepID=A0ABU7JVW8_9NOCA|nr:acetate uptake transporter [Rhodococcus sp. CC-R104]MEE2034059.1 acetate uptake transporter [Rhodococcus sp. CC-R104]
MSYTEDDPYEIAVPVHRGAHIADPGPLGLAAFALTTFILSSANAGFISVEAEAAVLGVALFYGGLTQLAAGMWEFLKGNVFGATAFSSYGGFWLSFWYLITYATEDMGDDRHVGVGIFLLGWTIFTVYMWFASSQVSNALFLTFSVLLVAFILLTLGAFLEQTGLTRVGGYLGLLAAFGAWYTSAAGVLSTTFGRVVIPTGPRGAGSHPVPAPQRVDRDA